MIPRQVIFFCISLILDSQPSPLLLPTWWPQRQPLMALVFWSSPWWSWIWILSLQRSSLTRLFAAVKRIHPHFWARPRSLSRSTAKIYVIWSVIAQNFTYLFLIEERSIARGVLDKHGHLPGRSIYPPDYLAVLAAQSLIADRYVVVREPTNLQRLIHDFYLFAHCRPIQRGQTRPNLSHNGVAIAANDFLRDVTLLLLYIVKFCVMVLCLTYNRSLKGRQSCLSLLPFWVKSNLKGIKSN